MRFLLASILVMAVGCGDDPPAPPGAGIGETPGSPAVGGVNGGRRDAGTDAGSDGGTDAGSLACGQVERGDLANRATVTTDSGGSYSFTPSRVFSRFDETSCDLEPRLFTALTENACDIGLGRRLVVQLLRRDVEDGFVVVGSPTSILSDFVNVAFVDGTDVWSSCGAADGFVTVEDIDLDPPGRILLDISARLGDCREPFDQPDLLLEATMTADIVDDVCAR